MTYLTSKSRELGIAILEASLKGIELSRIGRGALEALDGLCRALLLLLDGVLGINGLLEGVGALRGALRALGLVGARLDDGAVDGPRGLLLILVGVGLRGADLDDLVLAAGLLSLLLQDVAPAFAAADLLEEGLVGLAQGDALVEVLLQLRLGGLGRPAVLEGALGALDIGHLRVGYVGLLVANVLDPVGGRARLVVRNGGGEGQGEEGEDSGETHLDLLG